MFQFDFQNVQAIGDAHIQIEENSIVEFVGDNSNGKSVLSKMLDAITKGDLTDLETRNSLIKDYTEQAVFIMTYRTRQLGILLKRELKESYMVFTPNINDKDVAFVRNISDVEGCEQLVHKFGFRVYSKGDICLQIAPTFAPIPFISTSSRVNGEIVKDIKTDKVAQSFIDSFSGITYPAFKERVKNLKAQIQSMQTVLDNMELYDWRKYEEFVESLGKHYRRLEKLDYFELSEVPIPRFGNVPPGDFQLVEIPIIRIYDYGKLLTPIGKELDDYVSIMNGVCPTCKKRIID